MKKLTMYSIILISLGLVSCYSKIKKPNDLKNCVLLSKVTANYNSDLDWIQYINLNDSTRYYNYVDKFYSDKWNIGDTIK